MSSPVATIADALVAFILSLLRDPNAAEQFSDDPYGAMAGNGVAGACMADVRAVKPVIVDHPQVEPKPPTPPGPPPGTEPDEVVREIVKIMNQFTTVDARSTIVDQSVNQNIWTEGGDVTQLFDQEAVIASGDHAVAAGDDASIVDQDLDVTVGDVTVGNDTYNDSFNDVGDAEGPEATSAEGNGAEAAADAPQTPPSLPEPADHLESDLTATSDTYESDATAAPVEDATFDVPVDD